MAKIENEELKCIACDVIDDNQVGFKISDDRDGMLYTLAFNDGVLSFLDAITEKYYPEKCIKKFDPEEAADDKD